MVPTSLNPLLLLTPSNPFHISVCYARLYQPDLLSIFLVRFILELTIYKLTELLGFTVLTAEDEYCRSSCRGVGHKASDNRHIQ